MEKCNEQSMNLGISQSNKSFNAGDIILRIDEPLVQVTKYDHRLFVCDRCMRSVQSSVVCPVCQKVYYCGRECQDVGWNDIHQYECPILSRQKPLQFENKGIDYMQRLTLRLYLLLTQKETSRTEKYKLHNGLTRTLDQMLYHEEELENSAYFQGILNYFKLYKIENFDRKLLLRAYGILHVNSFGIDHYSEETTIEHRGTGLYVEASVFDHSCVPNACASGNDRMLEIRALSPIKPGDTIYIDYIQDVLPKTERLETLSGRYFFTCQCELGCKDGLGDKAFDSSVDYKRYKVLNNLIEAIQTSINEKPSNKVDWPQLHKLFKQRLAIQEQYYSRCGYHPCLSLFYQSYLQFAIIHHTKLSDIEDHCHQILMKAKEHLSITHGTTHPFYSIVQERQSTK